jgi:enoyl-CoA hydratase/carnithine racemase
MGLSDGQGVLESWADGSAAVLRLNRPKVHNALDTELMRCLSEELQRVDEDPAVRAVVLTGAGASFCSGDDLRALRDADEAEFRRSIETLQALTARLLHLTKPTVCALNGPAFGAGLELILACDARLATPGFVCATPEVRLGLIATNGATVLLPHLIGSGHARRMLLTGARMDGSWCLSVGLVDELVAPEALMSRALALATEYAMAGPDAVAATRRLLVAPIQAALDEALASEAEYCIAARRSGEGREGVRAYFSTRAPDWQAGT